jgi:predicted nuclease with TOPRIM domain
VPRMNTLTCALTLQSQLDAANDRIRQLEAENEMLRETLRLTAEERGRLEIDLKGLRAEWNAHD